MGYKSRAVVAQVERFGELATLYSRTSDGSDEFNNTEWTFDSDQTVLCFRTYPNRNTEVQQNAGDRNRDSPVFLFPLDEYEAVSDSDRIGYPDQNGNETLYELQAPTRYATHVEIYGEVVTN
ncbi:hypothetical protein [Halomonas sp.]|uniref:hypothetical protein n=1 Tax=Halomonas sp. TaxID=1486246 RepID=UPI00356B5ED5